MSKNTGMNARDEKEGKIPHLPQEEAEKVNKKLEDEKSDPPPTKTIALVQEERNKRKNDRGPNEKIFKSH